MSPHCHHDDKFVQYSFSSVVARNLLIEQIAAKFPAMSRDLSGAASYVYQNPKHTPDAECHFKKTITQYLRILMEKKNNRKRRKKKKKKEQNCRSYGHYSIAYPFNNLRMPTSRVSSTILN